MDIKNTKLAIRNKLNTKAGIKYNPCINEWKAMMFSTVFHYCAEDKYESTDSNKINKYAYHFLLTVEIRGWKCNDRIGCV